LYIIAHLRAQQTMLGKRAKILSAPDVGDLLVFASCTRHPLRNTVMVLLSAKAGLRAGEIANLTWDMVADANGQISGLIELADAAAKKCSGRSIPIHPDLAAALRAWRQIAKPSDYVITSERGSLHRVEQQAVAVTQSSGRRSARLRALCSLPLLRQHVFVFALSRRVAIADHRSQQSGIALGHRISTDYVRGYVDASSGAYPPAYSSACAKTATKRPSSAGSPAR
jgi:integrase